MVSAKSAISTFHVEHRLSLQVAARDFFHHFRNAAHLFSKVAGNRVHTVGEILPRACDSFDIRLTAQSSLSTHLAGDESDFRSEGVKLVHHDVDGVLQLQNFSTTVHGDFLREVPSGNGCRDRRNVAAPDW
jgi:hypothetical protein